jgi:hypothetical protein
LDKLSAAKRESSPRDGGSEVSVIWLQPYSLSVAKLA